MVDLIPGIHMALGDDVSHRLPHKPLCGRTMDPDMVLSHSMGSGMAWIQVAMHVTQISLFLATVIASTVPPLSIAPEPLASLFLPLLHNALAYSSGPNYRT